MVRLEFVFRDGAAEECCRILAKVLGWFVGLCSHCCLSKIFDLNGVTVRKSFPMGRLEPLTL